MLALTHLYTLIVSRSFLRYWNRGSRVRATSVAHDGVVGRCGYVVHVIRRPSGRSHRVSFNFESIFLEPKAIVLS